ncbi:hypothetical protein RI367_001256 [Sorochytrium milnesiophthora]
MSCSMETCTSCRRRHVRCDQRLPCGPCVNLGQSQQCTFTFKQKQRGPNARHIQQLRQRVKELEGKLAEATQTVQFVTSTPPPTPPSTTHLRDWPLTSDPIGTHSSDLAHHLVDLFVEYFADSVCPYYSEAEARECFRPDTAQPVLLYAVYSVAAFFSIHPGITHLFRSGIECAEFYTRKLTSMTSELVSQVSPSNMQALLIIVYREFTMGSHILAWNLCGLVLRICEEQVMYNSAGHDLLSMTVSKEDLIVYKHALVYAFNCNTMSSASCGRFYSISKNLVNLVEECIRTLYSPDRHQERRVRNPVPHCVLPKLDPVPATTPYASRYYMSRICIIIARILQLVNAPVDCKSTDPSAVHLLHQELMAFANDCSLVTQSLQPTMAQAYPTLMVLMMYHTALILLHRPLALQAHAIVNTATSFSAQQCLDAADQLTTIARHMALRPITTPVGVVSFGLMTAGTVYVQRSTAVPMDAVTLDKLVVLADTMDLNCGPFKVSQVSRYLRLVLDELSATGSSKHAALSASFPARYSRSDAGCTAPDTVKLLQGGAGGSSNSSSGSKTSINDEYSAWP